jgi:hypothetical protein
MQSPSSIWGTTHRQFAAGNRGSSRAAIAFTDPVGVAGITHYDRETKARIRTSTKPDGEAGVQHFDKGERLRIAAGTLADGAASVFVSDRDGKTTWSEVSP